MGGPNIIFKKSEKKMSSKVSMSEDYIFGDVLHIDKDDKVGIRTHTPAAPLHISGSALIINTPLSGSGAGTSGEIRWSAGADGNVYLWLCTGSSMWKGAVLAV